MTPDLQGVEHDRLGQRARRQKRALSMSRSRHRDARTRAHQHHTSEAEDLKLEVQRLRKRIESLRITLWETERDARTALKLLKIKNYENVANMCELIAESVNDALKIDTERE